MVLVHDAATMAAVLRRLHVLNDGVIFWNEQRSLKLMLRNDPVDCDTLACELALVSDEDDERAAKLLALANGGYMDEPGTYVLEGWSWPLADFDDAQAQSVLAAVNDAYLWRPCPCGEYVIKDDACMCVFCHMTSTPDSKREQFCPICCEDGMAMHMTRMPCCKQHLHVSCLDTWKAKSSDDRCPLCRQ